MELIEEKGDYIHLVGFTNISQDHINQLIPNIIGFGAVCSEES